MTAEALYAELRRLSRGRGVPTADLSTLGTWLPGDHAGIISALRQKIDLLPADLRLVALTALGLHPDTDQRFLQQRVSWLAATLCRDDRTIRRRIDEAFHLIAAQTAGPVRADRPLDSHRVPFLSTQVTVDVCPIELMAEVDILVASGYTHLEQSQTYKSSTSAALRRACAHRGPVGEITDDVLDRELNAWVSAHSRPGLTVAPGTVVPLPPGALSSRGVRRVYYAAVASARPGGNDYDIDPPTLATAVSNVFATASADQEDPPLRSVAFPILGAGRGKVPVPQSARWIRTALCQVLRSPIPWDVHLVTRNPALVGAISDQLTHPR